MLGAVIVLLQGGAGKVPEDRSWTKVRIMMARTDQFINSLINFEKENIPSLVLTELEPYLKDKEFDPDVVRSKSAAAAGLCSWVINTVRYHQIHSDLLDKRRALDRLTTV